MSVDTWTSESPHTATPSSSSSTTAALNTPTTFAYDANHAWLWRVMQKEKNRDMIARLEDELQRFVQDSAQTCLPFPPRPPFHRKVCFEVAKRYGLDHRLEHHPQDNQNHTSDDTVRLVLIKTETSTTPVSRLAEFAAGPPPNITKETETVSGQQQQQQQEEQQQAKPATFLRRQRTADGKTAPILLSASGQNGSGSNISGLVLGATGPPATLKGISEEDYQKARARIFEPPASNNNNTDRSSTSLATTSTATTEETLSKNLQQACKVRAVAKGPVEGSVGFERRRNRRNAANNNNNNNNNNTNTNNSNSTNTAQRRQQGRRDTTRGGSNNSRNGRDPRNSSTGNLNGGNTNNNNRQPLYIVQQNNVDLQDPDFDRRYDKWAVRHDPPTQHQLHQSHHHSQQQQQNQQIHVPIFSQLLYPYAVRAAPQPPHAAAVHHAGMHVPTTADTVQTQFQYPHPSHTHSSALIFQQLGQSISEYTAAAAAAGNTNAVITSTGYDVNARDMMLAAGPAHHLGHAHSAQMEQQQRQLHEQQLRSRNQYQTGQHHLQNSGLQNQVAAVSARQAPPAYGLDSTVDFPPLP